MPTSTRIRATAAQAVARADPRSDAELLDLFALRGEGAAFTTLVHRHGPLVYGVCRRALGATPDADDAFQATFLVLLRKVGSMSWRANLGPWLYGVATQVSRKARFRRDRRFAVEKQVDAMPHPESAHADPNESDELSRAFDEELAALPEEMRRAVVLCELQGRSRQQAAKELRVSEGTLSSRLARARKRLRDRLTTRGFALVIPGAVVVPARLTAAARMTDLSAGVVPAAVANLAQEAVKAMTISKLKLGVVLAVTALGFTGFGLTARGGGDGPKLWAKADPQVKPAAANVAAPDKPKKGQFELSISLRSTPQAVATINGEDLSREEFAEYLIRKHGAKEIELFVNKKIIEVEAKKRGVTASPEELEAAYRSGLKDVGVTPVDFVATVLPKYGKTEAEWREDVVRPRVLMEKMDREGVDVSEADLRALFERRYGERWRVQMAHWPKSVDPKEVRRLYDRVKDEPLLFDRFAVRVETPYTPQTSVITFQKGGRGTHPPAVEDAVFELKTANEVSDLIETERDWYAVRLVERVPAVAGKSLESERAALRVVLAREKLEQRVPKLFAELKEKAKPVYHLQPESKSQPQPTPLPRK